MDPLDPRHGTNAGYIAHAFTDRDYCDPCRTAAADYRRGLRTKRYLLKTDDMHVDATGSIRRIRALQALGWRFVDIDRAMGKNPTGPSACHAHNITRQDRVHVETARTVRMAYDRLSMTLAPGPYADRQRRMAVRRGYAPPLAYDEGTIDDPTVEPAGAVTTIEGVDEVLVERIVAGGYTLRANPAERREVCHRWVASGRSLAELEQLTGWRASRYLRVREMVA